ncbi:hypothetical protein AKJ65_07095 [candidate division MSBL1 archaeon SCGC-AAA259E19]|uniref:Glycoamylase-like domain-containing protein n=1 Tax=candidate division MSBL1 archaeon SCGC-AAA259E19 TaxID=1698264 RepID=A0A133UEX1_9EURY|nr:hypothetical protein AKJ65_07095 [candidate division MSBL1 archaeon SCGC-AAA259E19]
MIKRRSRKIILLVFLLIVSILTASVFLFIRRGTDSRWSELDPEEKEFLNKVERKAFEFFWNEADSSTGLIPDRTNSEVCSIASVGFGLSAVCIAEEREWVSYENAYEWVLRVLNSFYDDPEDPDDFVVDGSHGFFYHFVNSRTGERSGNSEISLIDTALLAAGVLHAGQHFEGTRVEKLADGIYRKIEWDWLQSGNCMKVTPDGVKSRGYDEYILAYILALGSPTHPISSDCWDGYASGYGWIQEWPQNYTGGSYLTPRGERYPLAYLYQFPACWIDFRGRRDNYANYWQSGINALKANRRHCLNWGENHGYSKELWGWTAADGPDGYLGYGEPYDGTLSPSAIGASISFLPEYAISSLKYIYEEYPKAWKENEYGFVDSFNPSRNWYASDYIGIDQGNLVLSIEDFRSGLVWKEFMRISYVQVAMEKAGFVKVDSNSS